jgi:hypothetical protein
MVEISVTFDDQIWIVSVGVGGSAKLDRAKYHEIIDDLNLGRTFEI